MRKVLLELELKRKNVDVYHLIHEKLISLCKIQHG